MLKLKVFDPPMCCSTGICGNSVDPRLVSFAADLEWLKKQNIDVIRYGLSFEPKEFVNNELVKTTLQKDGNDCLPLIVVNNEVVSKGCYPNRETLAKICGIEWKAEYASQEIPSVAIESSACGPDCDCHQSDVSDKTKKIIFAVVLLIIAGIIAVKLSCKAEAIERKQNNILITSKSVTPALGTYIDSANQIKSSQDTAFIYIPTQNNGKISKETKKAVLSAKEKLNARNITVDLYTLKTTSPDYASIASSSNPPAIIVAYKGQVKSTISGQINETRLLQAYVAATQAGCGSGCPCHK